MMKSKSMSRVLKALVLGILCCILIGSMTGCQFSSRADYLAKTNQSDKEQADATMQAIIDALEAKNAEDLKALFSTYAVENTEDLDENIEGLMEFYPGYSEGFKGNYSTREGSDYGVRDKELDGIYTVSNEGQTYRVGFTLQVRNDKEPEKIGLHLIEVMTPEAKPEGFKWKDEEDAPGVYVLE